MEDKGYLFIKVHITVMMMYNRFKVSMLLLLSFCCSKVVNAQETIPVFPLNTDSYACYRIPALIALRNGEMLAFAEGRKANCGDFGNVDIIMKRSSDAGRTWSKPAVLIDNDTLQAGNITPVVDRFDPRFPAGRIFVFYNTGNAFEWEIRAGKGLRQVWYITSVDNGKSWSSPNEITNQVHFPKQLAVNQEDGIIKEWRGYATGPCHALQITNGKFKGRMVVPANHTEGQPASDWSDGFAHTFFTDDHGATFHCSENVSIPGANEATVAMLSSGDVMLNARNQKGDPRCRVVAVSSDGSKTWDTAFYDKRLIDPVCQGSLLNTELLRKHLLIFSNPASQTNREKLTIRVSIDDGKSWSVSHLAVEGEAAYSDITMINRKTIGIIYEKGSDGGIYFRKLS
ncbi:MAG TPA: sialidase family protein, partial [Bacteroidales bacterium]|nr:sialidase family protein [Bacteroidales bacterium]